MTTLVLEIATAQRFGRCRNLIIETAAAELTRAICGPHLVSIVHRAPETACEQVVSKLQLIASGMVLYRNFISSSIIALAYIKAQCQITKRMLHLLQRPSGAPLLQQRSRRPAAPFQDLQLTSCKFDYDYGS